MNAPLSVVTFDPTPFLRALDDDAATFVEFSRNFLVAYPKALSALLAAAAARDADTLRERANAFKGSLAIFHAAAMVRGLEAIERVCFDAPQNVTAALMQPLAGPAAEFRAELDALCNRMQASPGVRWGIDGSALTQ